MDPFEYKDENFFPCITDEYRQRVRGVFRVLPKEEIEASNAFGVDDNEINDPFDEEKPTYERKANQPRRFIQKGSVFDLMEYFEGDGATSVVRCAKSGGDDDVTFQVVDPMTSLKGKHVLVVCVFVPSKWCGYHAERLCRLWVLSKEIASVDDFEILIVAKMRNKYEANVAAFNQFFSGFPNRLAVSFDHPDLRDDLCYNLGFQGKPNGILIDPDGMIVQDNLGFIEEYGASAFPFTDESLEAVKDGDMSLTSLLRCNPYTRLYKFGFPSESITVEQLSKKLVGLYLFRLGDKLDRLHEVYHLCQLSDKAKDVEPQFEIVLFCLPVAAIDPATFELEVHELLKMLKPGIDASSWWVCPYDNSAGLRLLKKCNYFFDDVDALVSIGANNKFIEFCGGELLCTVGYEAYPFSVEALIQRFVKWANQITLESLFTTYEDQLVKQDGSRIDVKELQYKNVLLYVDSIPSSNQSTLDSLTMWYPKLKQYETDVEVVFVSYTPSECGSVCPPESKSEIPWIVCPYHPKLSASLRNHSEFYGGCDGNRIMRGLCPASVVVFGKGGHIHVIDAMRFLLHNGPGSNPFSPRSKNLHRDIYHQMHHDIDFMRSLPSNLY